ncbi:hypothetical protein cypCar_00000572 [Cyprinus carpio]|nr:hypothetical protein cypCar_00000572 [Cyprinus carpio]
MIQGTRSGSSELATIRDLSHLTGGYMPNTWDRRCMRKQRRRTDDE